MGASDSLNHELVVVPANEATLEGDLTLPNEPQSLVVFAHGSGSSRHSPRNRAVADTLSQARIGTLLLDLLTGEEQSADADSAELRFNIDLLTDRLIEAVDWVLTQPTTDRLALGLFGASTGAAAALRAAAERAAVIKAVVSRGGRPDLAPSALTKVRCPTLFIVGGRDEQVLQVNEEAATRLPGEHEVAVVPGAGHLFEEPGALDAVGRLTREWYAQHLYG